ncbi:retrovirus-related pol polyprotein from transposon TNT 1-94, partial [Tanacetum coccineum]
IHKDGDGDASFQLESNSLPHAHAQTTKTYYKHQDLRIMKAQELKTKTSAQTLIYKIFLQRYQVYQGRLLASFQDDAKYEHVGQDTRSQGGKDDQEARKRFKDLGHKDEVGHLSPTQESCKACLGTQKMGHSDKQGLSVSIRKHLRQKHNISSEQKTLELADHVEDSITTPSYVAFTDSERLIGDAAKNQVAMNPTNTVFGFDAESAKGNDETIFVFFVDDWIHVVLALFYGCIGHA